MNWTYERACAVLDRTLDLEKNPLLSGQPTPALDRMARLAGALGNPQRKYPVIHITGTNGKTSVAQLIAALLGAAGLKVGVYSSPHLNRINERIVCDGQPIGDDDFAQTVGAVVEHSRGLAETFNYFELFTAAAFLWFAEVGVDVAVIEVGLLGRWDATNIADGQVAVVTAVGEDHIDYTGSIEGVAREKAGIVKPGSLFILGEDDARFEQIFSSTPAADIIRHGKDFAGTWNHSTAGGLVADLRTPGAVYRDVAISLHGAYQVDNVACALAAAEAFAGRPWSDPLVRAVLGSTEAPGRMEIVRRSPLCILDAAHNPPAAAALVRALHAEFPGREWIALFGALGGHDYAQVMSVLTQLNLAAVVACEPLSPRAIEAAEIVRLASRHGLPGHPVPLVRDGVRRALELATGGRSLLVTGSFYHLAAAREALAEMSAS